MPEETLAVNVCNFSKGAEGQPSLLSPDDARTLFHEFGHGLHGMLSSVTYPSLAGTNVARDYVEFPSQLLEHWLTTREVLDNYAAFASGEFDITSKIKALAGVRYTEADRSAAIVRRPSTSTRAPCASHSKRLA